MTKLRLAIVGAGPAGIYAADILTKTEKHFDVSIDLFEQLPAPYGLVRYGVAPDTRASRASSPRCGMFSTRATSACSAMSTSVATSPSPT